MFERLSNWLKERFSADDTQSRAPLRQSGAHRVPAPPHRRAQRPARPPVSEETEFVDVEPHLAGRIEENGPGKNVLIRNKYVREETGTYETLKILDDSLVDSGEETGIDPYNTGGFDRSRNWDKRFRN